MKISIERLCKEVPKEFEIYMTYIKNLQFSEDPDYEFLKDLFHKIFEAEGFSYESADFDWSKRGNLPTDVNRYVRSRKKHLTQLHQNYKTGVTLRMDDIP